MWDWLFDFIGPLDRERIPYAIVGSVATSVYGEPRATNDVDMLILIREADVERLQRAFPEDRFYLPPAEVIRAELGRPTGAHLNVIPLETMIKADLYPLPAAEEEWLARRREVRIAGRPAWLAAPETVILHKLRFHGEGGGEKHLRDVRGMLAVSGDRLDHAWLGREIARLGLQRGWDLARHG
jgi:hypothetical protein